MIKTTHNLFLFLQRYYFILKIQNKNLKKTTFLFSIFGIGVKQIKNFAAYFLNKRTVYRLNILKSVLKLSRSVNLITVCEFNNKVFVVTVFGYSVVLMLYLKIL